MSAPAQAAAVRAGAGLFRLRQRGLLRVEGGDRLRWLDGMLSNDVTALSEGHQSSGCYALLLTRQGRIVADFHVLLRRDCFWLEVAREGLAKAIETLERFIIADDVALADASDELERLGLEGSAAPAALAAALGRPLELHDGACDEVEIAGAKVLVAAFGWSGAPARQLFVPRGAAESVAGALLEAGAGLGLLEADFETLEILRVEAGIPALGSELDEEVLPAEARLERAISTSKGCYTGQEVVARMHSRGRVGHLLVGIRLGEGSLPEPGAEIAAPGGKGGSAGGDVAAAGGNVAAAGGNVAAAGGNVAAAGRKLGELTSACVSPAEGPIALGYVRAAHAEPGSEVLVGGRTARLAALPFPVVTGERW